MKTNKGPSGGFQLPTPVEPRPSNVMFVIKFYATEFTPWVSLSVKKLAKNYNVRGKRADVARFLIKNRNYVE